MHVVYAIPTFIGLFVSRYTLESDLVGIVRESDIV